MSSLRERASWLAVFGAEQLGRQLVKRVIYDWCIEGGRPLDALFGQPTSEHEHLGLLPVQRQQLLAARSRIGGYQVMLTELERRGVGLITRADPAYPESLAQRLPEKWLPYYFFYQGSLDLLTQPGIGVVGGRQPTAGGRTMAHRVAEDLATDGHQLIDGYDRGVERLAMRAAMEADGSATVILPMGIEGLERVQDEIPSALLEDKLLVMSPYTPNTPFSEPLASARRVLLGALSEALLLIEPDHEPATWSWLPQFRSWGGRLSIWHDAGIEANRVWLEAGAVPFSDASSARSLVRDLFGGEAVLGGEGRPLSDALAETEPAFLADADATAEFLGRSGKVPEALQRRLRDRPSSPESNAS